MEADDNYDDGFEIMQLELTRILFSAPTSLSTLDS